MNERLKNQLIKEYNLVAFVKDQFADISSPLHKELSDHAKILWRVYIFLFARIAGLLMVTY